MKNFVPTICLLFCSVCMFNTATAQITYRVDFEATWSAATHAGAYPGGAHFSPLVGATHDATTTLWESGALASAGIEQMAETGGTSLLRNEINSTLGNDRLLLTGGAGSPGSRSFEFETDASNSLVSLVTSW